MNAATTTVRPTPKSSEITGTYTVAVQNMAPPVIVFERIATTTISHP